MRLFFIMSLYFSISWRAKYPVTFPSSVARVDVPSVSAVPFGVIGILAVGPAGAVEQLKIIAVLTS